MAGKLNIAGSAIALDAAMGRVAAATGARYLGLTTGTVPGVASTLGTVTEYVRTGYSRQAVTVGASTGTGPRTQSHTNALTIGPLTGANGTDVITGWFICDAASGTVGNIIAQGDLTPNRTPQAGDSFTAAAGAFTWTID